MDGALKALVGAACIAIIAVAGFYFYSEYSASKAHAAYTEQQNMVRACKEAQASGYQPALTQKCYEGEYLD